jgi:tetratricopeptide (TPR) repeat protein
VDQALADWKLALEKVSEPKDFHNPYLKIEEVRDWFDQAILRFQEGQDPEKTQAVAELYRKIAPGGGAELKIAQAAEAVAAQLAEKLKLKLDNVTPEIVHAQYGRAGDAFEQAAKVRPEADSLEPLWRSAQCYIAGKHVARAEQILSQFVKQEMNETRLAEGWCLLGDLYRGEKKKAFAHDAYLKCIQFPDTPFAYRSRYFLALEEEIDNKNLEKARAILHDNLVSSGDVERQWQEKSLFKMASLLMKMKNYGEAHFHLKECLRLYPENPNTLLAREQLGDCYRRLAELERAKEYALRDNIKPGMPEESRLPLEEGVRQQRKTRIDTLSQAVRTYQDLADELEKTQARAKSLSNLEQVLLLRAWVGIGDCHLDGEEYDQSLRVFQTLQSKYRRTLEGFYASHRICYTLAVMEQQPLPKKQVDQVREQAKESIRLLTEDLKSLPNEHEMFRLPGVSSREDWLRWAEDTQRKLLAPPKNESGLPAFR